MQGAYVFPLSFAQKRLWIIDQLSPNSPIYNIPLRLRFRGNWDAVALGQSINCVVQRHEILRTVFAMQDGQPMQFIAPSLNIPLEIIDLEKIPESMREDHAEQLSLEEASKPFDLSHGPFLRASVIRMSASDSILLITVHHIVFDAWSVALFYRELAAFYTGLTTKQAVDLPALPIQYADYACWQHSLQQRQVLDEQLAYWKHHLADAPTVLALPSDLPRPATHSFRGSLVEFALSAELTAALKALGQQEDATLFMTLLAAFQLLLARYSGQDDIVVGTPIAGRSRAELENLIGFFVNTLVLRTKLDGNPSFRELVRRVREVALQAYAHQDLPFEQLVSELRPDRSASHMPLVQVYFAFDNTPKQHPHFAQLSVQPLRRSIVVSQYDLAVTVAETSGHLVGRIEYSTDLFYRETIMRMMGHFKTLLHGIVVDPEQHMALLPLLTEDEQRIVVGEWNATGMDYPHDKCLHELFVLQAVRSPDAPAVICQKDALSYDELNVRANRLAHYLQALGVGPGVPVGICVKPTLDLAVGILGILKAGGAYLPLDPQYPVERLAFMINDAHVHVLITHGDLFSRDDKEITVIALDRDQARIARESSSNPASGIKSDDLAYIIYTSGSTGIPKGVMVEHRHAVNTLWASQMKFGFSSSDIMPTLAQYSFDIWLFEFMNPLLSGGTSILLGREDILDMHKLATIIDTATALHAVPSLMRQLVSFIRSSPSTQRAAQKLQRVFVGGDLVTPSLLTEMRAVFPNAAIFVLYGPTETTIICSSYRTPDVGSIERHIIGKPLPNVKLHIVDQYLNHVPIGVPGEILIGGASVARGYLHKPELTAARFVQRDSERYYRTGDLARYLPNGSIEFLGRRDTQVKVRGYRIELGEIEMVLGQHPCVREAVVVTQIAPSGENRLVAYIVPSKDIMDSSPSIGKDRRDKELLDSALSDANQDDADSRNDSSSLATQLRSFVSTYLPTYMVPSRFVLLDELPLGPTGKIDRNALSSLSTIERRDALTMPRTPAEETLSRIWSEVLSVESVSIYDNFFELGGDSILSIRVITRANEAGLVLKPHQVFQHQTIAELAAAVQRPKLINAEQGIVLGPVALTPIQTWFFKQDFVNPHHFNQAVIVKSRQAVDPVFLSQAVYHLLRHHDALRLRFKREKENWYQSEANLDDATPFDVIDLASLTLMERRQAIKALIHGYQTSLDLTDGPLFRVVLFNFGVQEPARVFIVAHHLVIDSVSWDILREDLEAVYQQLQHSDVIHLSAKTTSFQEWAHRLRTYAQSIELQQELDYWLSQKWQSVRPLPKDYAADAQANTVESSREISVSLSSDETRELLKQMPSTHHTYINEVLLAAFVDALAPWIGRRSLVIDLEGHGREPVFDDVDLSRTVGWFTSRFPVLLDLEGAELPSHILESVKSQLRAIPQRGMGFGVLRYLSDADVVAKLALLPQAEISFNYLGQLLGAVAITPLFEPDRMPSTYTLSPLALRSHLFEINVSVTQGQLHIRWRYSKAIHRRATIKKLARAFKAALQRFIASSRSLEQRLPEFPLVRLDQSILDRLTKDADIQDVYPLAPTQQGILFQCLYEPGSGVYIEHWLRTISEQLDTAAFYRAWQSVLARYDVFRTAFVWEGFDEPLQIVRNAVILPWEEFDWRKLTQSEQESRLRSFLAADQLRGFDLSQAPLFRITLIRLADNLYQCVWTLHHLLMDGWSMPIVLKDVFAYYDAFRQAQQLTLDRPRPYREYISWLRQRNHPEEEVFWRKKMAGFAAPTPLALDHRSISGVRATNKVEAQEITFQPEMATTIQQFARNHRLTLNSLVQGAWALLMSRYSGEADILYGTVVSGRSADLPGIESMVGLFMNTLPVRVQVPPAAQVLSWLKQLQEDQSEARRYEHTALVDIQRWSQIQHGVSLFEAVLVFENYPDYGTTGMRNRGETVDRIRIRSFEQTHYPLTVMIFPGTVLTVRISYDTGRFEADAIMRMLGHLRTLLVGIVMHPKNKLAEIPLLTASERDQMLYAWNNTQLDVDWQMSLIQRFDAQTKSTPHKVAFICGDQYLTYDELNLRANFIGHQLQAAGVGPEVYVGLCVERSLELPIGLIGILKAGGVYVPLDPEYPSKRLEIMIDDTQPRVIMTQPHLLDRLPPVNAKLIYLDADDDTAVNAENVVSHVAPENLAYVMYTSGSTGKPKGSALEHKQLLNRFTWMWNAFPFTSDDVLCQKTSINFVDSIWELLGGLLQGIPAVIVSNAAYRDTDAFIVALAAHKVTRVWLLPSVLAQILNCPDVADRLPHLTHWVMGGEVLTASLVQRFHRLLPDRFLINLYGSSELFDATAYVVDEQQDFHTHMPIGKPISNTQTYVLDAYVQPGPIGITGELYVGGVCLPRGYINRPELTSARFIPDPFSGIPGARLFKTGDLARYRAEGTIECLGRLDHQIKLRGYRIELGEIEEALMQDDRIRKSVVLLREDEPGEPYLAAYLITTSKEEVSVGEVRQLLKKQLPEYMIPTSFMFVESFPYTPSGKVDRRALPSPPVSDRFTINMPFFEPQSHTERVLAGIFADILHVSPIGKYDDFFDLGGHSLLALRVISRVRDEFQVELPVRAVFDASTVASLAQHISVATTATPMISRRPEDSAPPLSFGQQRLWFLDQLYRRQSNYNLHTALYLRGNLDVTALEEALNALIARHEVLRTVFITQNGEPRQFIAPSQKVALKRLDLARDEQKYSTTSDAALRAAADEIKRPFDLTVGPLLRGLLIHLSSTQHLFVITIHHSISDGWSMSIINRELAAFYTGLTTKQVVDLPALPIQYADYACWQHSLQQRQVLDEQLAYWKHHLADAPTVLALPSDLPRPATHSFRGSLVEFALSAELTAALKALGQQEDATLFMTLLAAFQLLLARYSGQDDIVVGTPIAGRSRAELENLIGFFVNTLVLRTKLDGNPSFRELVRRVREVALQAYAHQDLPFEQLVSELQPDRSLRQTPLFQVLVNFVNTPHIPLTLPNLTIEMVDLESPFTRFPLTLYINNVDSQIILHLAYQTELFSEGRVRQMIGQFIWLLTQVQFHPDEPIDSYSLVTPNELEALPDPSVVLLERDYTPVMASFLDCARKWPHLPAIHQQEQIWTYKEIADSVGTLAQLLREKTLRHGEVIAVTGSRSCGYIVGMLAVLLAGGILLTLDSRLPIKRKLRMLDDAGCRCVVEVGGNSEDSWLREAGVDIILWEQMTPELCHSAIPMSKMEAMSSEIHPDDPAYIFFTSGTEGSPKGILGSHKGLSHFVVWQRDKFAIGPHDRLAQLTGVSFDVVLRDVFLPLTSGATLCLPYDLEDLSADRILPWMEQEGITLLHTVPAIVTSWLSCFPEGITLKSLRLVFFAGEPLSDVLVEKWRAAFPVSAKLVNLYGPTETTLAKLYYELPAKVSPGIQPVGWALPVTQALVLAPNSRLCGIAEPGEIVIRTPYRSLGYIGASAAGQTRFMKNPFLDDKNDILYHTGDKGRYREDGTLEILGRIDDQVKIRGVRVEPNEINALLLQHPDVQESIVLGCDSHDGDKYLVAYISLKEQELMNVQELRAFLAEHVPDSMIPTTFVFMDHLPLTANGKVDRRALSAPPISGSQTDEREEPKTSVGIILKEIWMEVLSINSIGFHDNFFMLGGHSLLATRMMWHVRDVFRIDIPLRVLFEKPTIASLASAIEDILKQDNNQKTGAIVPVPRELHQQ